MHVILLSNADLLIHYLVKSRVVPGTQSEFVLDQNNQKLFVAQSL